MIILPDEPRPTGASQVLYSLEPHLPVRLGSHQSRSRTLRWAVNHLQPFNNYLCMMRRRAKRGTWAERGYMIHLGFEYLHMHTHIYIHVRTCGAQVSTDARDGPFRSGADFFFSASLTGIHPSSVSVCVCVSVSVSLAQPSPAASTGDALHIQPGTSQPDPVSNAQRGLSALLKPQASETGEADS
ncbi:hypothetical protein CC80DRAFT_144474 [Byssothecium circinans]|uniref:Uncharacterized protein n=1 Tax=Byssothecium circinans TaxID=147558 RepID=A0A6A5TKV0_9PLEO|nr:hypothetical protein CC80DRAFT_144474 [Byssothecium circinans]